MHLLGRHAIVVKFSSIKKYYILTPKVNSHNVRQTLFALSKSSTQKLVCIELFRICLGRQIKIFVIFPVVHQKESMFIWNCVVITTKIACITVIPVGLAIRCIIIRVCKMKSAIQRHIMCTANTSNLKNAHLKWSYV